MATQLMKDPVCGMMIDPTTAAGKSEYKGETYYFCAEGCRVDFEAKPEMYLDPNFVPSGMPDVPRLKRWWEFWR